MNRFALFLFPVIFFVFPPLLNAEDSGPLALRPPGYVVVVSKTTLDDPAWNRVVSTLLEKHAALDAKAVVYDDKVDEVAESLKNAMPRFVCFVARPDETSKDFVTTIHRMTRNLDDDPFPDVFWGILTGYDAEAALRVAGHAEPLEIRRVAASTPLNLDRFESGVLWNDSAKNRVLRKDKGDAKVREIRGPDDPTADMVALFNAAPPDLWLTSGHATERDWEIGFNYKAGKFVHRDGRIFGKTLSGEMLPVDSPNPKVYMPVGNCLIGHVDKADCMASAYFNSAGVTQMLGYTVPTWFGFAGWGVNEYFLDQPGRYTFTEAFFANQVALDWCIGEYMKAHPDFDPGENRRMTRENRDIMGLLFDRHVVAFYGDPAWEARTMDAPRNWEQKLEIEAGGDDPAKVRMVFTVTPERPSETKKLSGESQPWNSPRPIVEWFPRRFSNVKVVEGEEFDPIVTDNFLLLPRHAEIPAVKIVLEAR